ncbi:hypothetical protein Gotur_021585, partial [Gossypium turneri]
LDTWVSFLIITCQSHVPDMVLHGMFLVLPKPYPKHGLTGDLSSGCQRHVPDMVLLGTSHNLSAHAMSQTWSYGEPLISVPMPCPRHGLIWDLITQMP